MIKLWYRIQTAKRNQSKMHKITTRPTSITNLILALLPSSLMNLGARLKKHSNGIIIDKIQSSGI